MESHAKAQSEHSSGWQWWLGALVAVVAFEDNRDEGDHDHYDGLGGQLDDISEEPIDRGVKDW